MKRLSERSLRDAATTFIGRQDDHAVAGSLDMPAQQRQHRLTNAAATDHHDAARVCHSLEGTHASTVADVSGVAPLR